MAGLVQIRNVPDSTRKKLKSRAAERGESLNDYLLRLLETETSKPTMAEVLARIDARSERSSVSSVEFIRADRDRRS